jgi:hypothetical protein
LRIEKAAHTCLAAIRGRLQRLGNKPSAPGLAPNVGRGFHIGLALEYDEEWRNCISG